MRDTAVWLALIVSVPYIGPSLRVRAYVRACVRVGACGDRDEGAGLGIALKMFIDSGLSEPNAGFCNGPPNRA